METKIKTLGLVKSGMMTAIMCILSPWTFTIQLIPITLSVAVILLIGSMLTPFYAVLSVTAYILLGGFGLPIFSNARAGFGVLFGPTGGYILAYIFMVLIVSFAIKIFKKRTLTVLIPSFLLAIFVCYLFGTAWFMGIKNMGENTFSLQKALQMCVIPFIVPDLLKAATVCIIVIGLQAALPKRFWK